MALVANPNRIRLAMLGMVDGNGHPYSWSAIINGRYDRQAMADCGFPAIPQYLDAQPPEALGIAGAEVTHVWCDDPAEARKVARATGIAHVVERPEDVIGQVDAVIIPTDRGNEHVARAAPFVEARLPLFIDKPLVDNEADLRQFVRWQAAGHPVLSTSGMRYAREFAEVRGRLGVVGRLRLMTITMCKSWERYGIHALESVYPLLRPGGWISAANTGQIDANIVHARHADGVEVVLATIDDLRGAFGHLAIYGSEGAIVERFRDTFHAFKAQLIAFVDFLRTGQPPFPFTETVELMKLVIAGIRSRHEGGRTVLLSEIES